MSPVRVSLDVVTHTDVQFTDAEHAVFAPDRVFARVLRRLSFSGDEGSFTWKGERYTAWIARLPNSKGFEGTVYRGKDLVYQEACDG